MLIDHQRAGPEILGGQLVGGNTARDFVGVNVDRNGLASLALANGATVVLDFVAGAYDVGGWFDPSTPTFVTVPAGVTRVRHSFGMLFTGAYGSARSVFCDAALNGAFNDGNGRMIYVPQNGVLNDWNFSGPSYPVTPGDRIGTQMFASSIPSATTIFGNVDCNLTVEAVTMEF